jgi:prephenate dehydratase
MDTKARSVRAAYSRTEDALGRAAVDALAADAELVACDTVREVLATVARGDADLGIVPFEDSVHGSAVAVVDHLVFGSDDLVVVAEHDQPDPDADPPATRRHVAIATTPRLPDGAAQTLVFVVPGFNRPGTLTEVLASFSSRGINLTRVESRPLAGHLGMYGFVVEFEGAPTDDLVQEALGDVLAAASTVKFLGTFAAGDRAWGQVTGREVTGNLLRGLVDLQALAQQLLR